MLPGNRMAEIEAEERYREDIRRKLAEECRAAEKLKTELLEGDTELIDPCHIQDRETAKWISALNHSLWNDIAPRLNTIETKNQTVIKKLDVIENIKNNLNKIESIEKSIHTLQWLVGTVILALFGIIVNVIAASHNQPPTNP